MRGQGLSSFNGEDDENKTSLERARENNLDLSSRQWRMLEIAAFYHSNIWRYTHELQRYAEEPFVWLLSVMGSFAVQHSNSMNDFDEMNNTFVVKDLHGPDNFSLTLRHKPIIRWFNEQEISWKHRFVKVDDVYGNSLNCYAIIFKNQEDLLLTKMTWE